MLKDNRSTGDVALRNIEIAKFLPQKKSLVGLSLGVASSSIANKGMITITYRRV